MFGQRLSQIAIALCATLLAQPVLSQEGGSISGKVVAEGGKPLIGARIRALTASGTIAGSVLSREDGTYRITNVTPGSYAVVATAVGYAMKRTEGVTVTSGGVATTDFTMTEIVTNLNPVVTTASRRPEKALSAPASVSVVDVEDIRERPSVTVTDHLKGLAGVDINQGGVAQSNVVARGFNNAFSGSILMLQDYRFAGVPSLRVNVPFLMTGTNEDVERVEVLLGPASALYGPNSANGVLHVITKSPFSSQGTTLTVDGGERSLFRGAIRHAGLITPKLGYKLSGEYFMAKDWEYKDPGEPDVFPAQAPVGRAGQPNNRDFDLRRFTGEARVDYRPTNNSEFVTTYGYTNVGSGLELTGANGTSQIKGWKYNSLQQRMRVGRFFAQAFANFSNAGNKDSLDTGGTFLLRSGQPIVDQSRVFAAQIQHGISFGTRQDFVYGADYIFTNPRTGGTINGRNEDIDNVTEYGAYVQSTTGLSKMFDFIAALRVDKNDQIDGTQISPRVAFVFKPSETQNIRFTYNRAFSTPANFSYFLDLIQARNVLPGYNVRALGNPPKSGWTFNRSCNGLCMKSVLGGANNPWLPAQSSAAAYPVIVSAIAPQLRAAITTGLTPQVGAAQAAQLAAGIVQFLGTLRPSQAEAGSRLGVLGQSPTLTVDPAAVKDIGPLDASYNKTYEIGYKGIIGNKLRIAVDGWYQQRGDVGNPAGLATPGVFYNPSTLGAFIGPRLGQFLGSLGLPPATVQALATALTPQIAGGLASAPQGIVQFNSEKFANPQDFYATYTSTTDQEFTVKGVDVAVDLVATPSWTISGTYSWVSDLLFSDIVSSNNAALMLNAPDNKASLAFKYRNEVKGWGAEFRGRYANAYPVNSGVYASGLNLQNQVISFPRPGSTTGERYSYAGVPVAALVDIGVNKRFNVAGAREFLWSINGTNIFDNKRRSFPGSPEIGRMVVTRLQYQF